MQIVIIDTQFELQCTLAVAEFSKATYVFFWANCALAARFMVRPLTWSGELCDNYTVAVLF